jgi:hypothetical protein
MHGHTNSHSAGNSVVTRHLARWDGVKQFEQGAEVGVLDPKRPPQSRNAGSRNRGNNNRLINNGVGSDPRHPGSSAASKTSKKAVALDKRLKCVHGRAIIAHCGS